MESLRLFTDFINRDSLNSIPFYLIFTKKNVFSSKLRVFDLTSVPFESELPEELKIHKVLSDDYRTDLFYNILKIRESELSEKEKTLLEHFASYPLYSPSQLISIIKGEYTPKDDNDHQQFVEKNIQYFTQQFFNSIQDPVKKEQVIRDHKVIDITEYESTIQTMHSLFTYVLSKGGLSGLFK